MGFMDLEKVYDSVNREVLWQDLWMNDMGGKLLSWIKSIYVNSLARVGVKEGESEGFWIDSGVKQDCIVVPWLFNV